MKKLLFITLSTFALSGCVTQQDADAKMARGCAAGIKSMIVPKEIKEIKSKIYSDEMVDGGLHRLITLNLVEKDGWLELDKQYSCLFAQEWGPFKTSHDALLMQIRIDNSVYGKVDGKITGSIDDFMKLTDAVSKAMYNLDTQPAHE